MTLDSAKIVYWLVRAAILFVLAFGFGVLGQIALVFSAPFYAWSTLWVMAWGFFLFAVYNAGRGIFILTDNPRFSRYYQ